MTDAWRHLSASKDQLSNIVFYLGKKRPHNKKQNLVVKTIRESLSDLNKFSRISTRQMIKMIVVHIY